MEEWYDKQVQNANKDGNEKKLESANDKVESIKIPKNKLLFK